MLIIHCTPKLSEFKFHANTTVMLRKINTKISAWYTKTNRSVIKFITRQHCHDIKFIQHPNCHGMKSGSSFYKFSKIPCLIV